MPLEWFMVGMLGFHFLVFVGGMAFAWRAMRVERGFARDILNGSVRPCRYSWGRRGNGGDRWNAMVVAAVA